MQKRLSASVMCADLNHLETDLRLLEDAGADFIHCDIMDGSFVPNIMLGFDMVNGLRRATSLPLDIHLMVEKPERFLSLLAVGAKDFVSLHYESTVHLERALMQLRSTGCKTGVALNPQTSILLIEDLLPIIDMVTIMTVSPGFAGQKMFAGALEKIRRTRAFLDERGFAEVSVEVDGNVNVPNARIMSEHGADIFVVGSSGLFMPGLSLAQAAAKLREAVGT